MLVAYAMEGHVPARDIQPLLREKPKALGWSVPRLPVASPGMDVLTLNMPETAVNYTSWAIKMALSFGSSWTISQSRIEIE